MAGEAYTPKFIPPDEARVLPVPEVVALEQAIERSGTSLATLMRRAGTAAAEVAKRELGLTGRGRIVILAGSGNNGGDGWVMAELLSDAGFEVSLASTRPIDGITAQPARDAAEHTRARARQNLELLEEPSREAVAARLQESALVVDALLGTGFASDTLRGATAEWIDLLSAFHVLRESQGIALPRILSVDVPSGLNAQTGTATTPAVRADRTVTMLAVKPGLQTGLGRILCGDLVVADIA